MTSFLFEQRDCETISKVLNWKNVTAEEISKQLLFAFNQFAQLKNYEPCAFIGAGVNGVVIKIRKRRGKSGENINNSQRKMNEDKSSLMPQSLILKLFRSNRSEGIAQKEFSRFNLAPQVWFIGRFEQFPLPYPDIQSKHVFERFLSTPLPANKRKMGNFWQQQKKQQPRSQRYRSLNLIGMDAVNTTLERMINRRAYSGTDIERAVRKVINMIDFAFAQGLTHGDVHWDNIGLRFKKESLSPQSSPFSFSSSPTKFNNMTGDERMRRDIHRLIYSDYVFLDFGEATAFGRGRPYPVLLDLLQLLRNARADTDMLPKNGSHLDIKHNWSKVYIIVKNEITRRYPSLDISTRKKVNELHRLEHKKYDAYIFR